MKKTYSFNFPPKASKKLQDWFSTDYDVLWVWGVKLNEKLRWYCVVRQYSKITCVSLREQSPGGEYNIKCDRILTIKELREGTIWKT